MKPSTKITALACLLFASSAVATFGSMVPADRLPGGNIWASNKVGVIGGIPTVTTIYAYLSPSANDWGIINKALLTCPSNQVVYLNAGTYTITNTLYFGTIWNSFFSRRETAGWFFMGGPGPNDPQFYRLAIHSGLWKRMVGRRPSNQRCYSVDGWLHPGLNQHHDCQKSRASSGRYNHADSRKRPGAGDYRRYWKLPNYLSGHARSQLQPVSMGASNRRE